MIKTRNWDRLGNGGLAFTEIGFGSAPLGNLYRAIDEATADATLAAAWDAGIRYYDTAPQYGLGLAERRIGRFLRDKPRSDYVLSTKIGRLLHLCPPEERFGIGKFIDVPSRRVEYDYSYDGVLRSLEFSLERLGLDRIDIVYAHDLDVFTHGRAALRDRYIAQFLDGGYRALQELRDQGVIRAFGAGVNEWQACQILAERGDFDIFLLAGRYSLLEQEALESFLPLCQARGIGIALGGVYNSGILATGPVDGAMYNYSPAPLPILARVGTIQAICQDHGVRLADAALRFPLAHPVAVTALLGFQHPDQVRQNLAGLDAAIPAALWADLKTAGLIRADAPVA